MEDQDGRRRAARRAINTVRLTSPSAPGIDVDTLIVPETAEVFPLTGPGPPGTRARRLQAAGRRTPTPRRSRLRSESEASRASSCGANRREIGPANGASRPAPARFPVSLVRGRRVALAPRSTRPAAGEGREFSPRGPAITFRRPEADSGAESSNRIGFAVTMSAGRVRPVPLPDPGGPTRPGRSFCCGSMPSDTDGDGRTRTFPSQAGRPSRLEEQGRGALSGPRHPWSSSSRTARTAAASRAGRRSGFSGWPSRSPAGETVVMAYREHSLSRAGTSPFSGLSPYLGRGGGRAVFWPTRTSSETRAAAVFLDGRKVDPFATPRRRASAS